MNTVVKYLLYFIIFVKIIFILTIIRYKITLSYSFLPWVTLKYKIKSV